MNTNWQTEPATEKQVASITRMNAELGWSEPIPTTKGEAGIIIGKMKAEEKQRKLIQMHTQNGYTGQP
ncbi:MAG TPA: hypothetical protein VGM89_15630 [Puia sp.]|jgi:hypothetical protein